MEMETFTSVFDAIADTPAESANIKARSELLCALKEQIVSWNVSHEIAAAKLGITRSRMDDLLQGKLGKFSLAALVNLVTAAGLMFEIRVRVKG